MSLLQLDHIQLAMPEGGKAAARGSYEGLLGLEEAEKPDSLEKRSGCGSRKGRGASRLVARLEQAGVMARQDELLPGHARVYVDDPFGNRIELMDKAWLRRPGRRGKRILLSAFRQTLVHFPFLPEDFLQASMKAMPATPSSMPGNMTSLPAFLPERRAMMARAASV